MRKCERRSKGPGLPPDIHPRGCDCALCGARPAGLRDLAMVYVVTVGTTALLAVIVWALWALTALL